MTYTGPQKYPPASTIYWYQAAWGGDQMETNVCTWHTTEGRTVPSYADSSGHAGANAPNFTVLPDLANRKLAWYQHFDVDRSSRALVNLSGGVETNTNNNVQVELVGTCDPATRDHWVGQGLRQNVNFVFWPEAPDWALEGLALFVKWLHDNHDVKISSTVTWKAYPGSYGTSNGVRLSGSAWNAYYGHLGHQHVPENVHGDPGSINWKRIEELAIGEVNVALTKADVTLLVKQDDVIKSPDYLLDTVSNKFWTIESYLYETYRTARDGKVAADNALVTAASVKKAVADLSVKVDALAVGGIDLDALAVKVADLLAKRLAD